MLTVPAAYAHARIFTFDAYGVSAPAEWSAGVSPMGGGSSRTKRSKRRRGWAGKRKRGRTRSRGGVFGRG